MAAADRDERLRDGLDSHFPALTVGLPAPATTVVIAATAILDRAQPDELTVGLFAVTLALSMLLPAVALRVPRHRRPNLLAHPLEFALWQTSFTVSVMALFHPWVYSWTGEFESGGELATFLALFGVATATASFFLYRFLSRQTCSGP